MTELIILNFVATCFTAFWLVKKTIFQKEIIDEQNKKLNKIKVFTEILEKYINPEDIEKLLLTKKTLMEQDIEILRRNTIKETNESLKNQWGKVIEKNVLPQYNEMIEEFSSFIFTYFSHSHFENKMDRDGHIRLYFPKQQTP